VINGELELDVCVPLGELSEPDAEYVRITAARHLAGANLNTGLAIEIRYNFNPNDSARLRKDVHMAELLAKAGYTGVYLIFCTISPRDEAIARLKRAGWIFLVGVEAASFMNDLIGMDISAVLSSQNIRTEVTAEVKKMMQVVFGSKAVTRTVLPYLK